jgi:hypothetical protein
MMGATEPMMASLNIISGTLLVCHCYSDDAVFFKAAVRNKLQGIGLTLQLNFCSVFSVSRKQFTLLNYLT